MAEFLPRRCKEGDLVLSTIADARGDARVDLANSLARLPGILPGPVPARGERESPRVAQRVAATTGPIKARRRHLDSLLNMQIINTIWPHLSNAAKPYFMRKTLPMTAGISNVFLRDSWIDRQGEKKILEYTRVASTGPSVPFLLSPTTVGGQMSIGVSYRVTGFSPAKVNGILDAFF